MNGRAAGVSYGALAVHTGDADTLSTRASLAAVRMKRNVLGESSIGFIASAGDPALPAAGGNATPPADGSYRATQTLSFTVNYSENVTVVTTGGTPTIALTIGSTARS